MNPSLSIGPALETGTLRAVASLQDPDVRLRDGGADGAPSVVIEEGGVVVELEFFDPGSLRRFQRRLAALSPPTVRRRSA